MGECASLLAAVSSAIARLAGRERDASLRSENVSLILVKTEASVWIEKVGGDFSVSPLHLSRLTGKGSYFRQARDPSSGHAQPSSRVRSRALCLKLSIVPYEPHHEKTCLCHMQTKKTQISLCIHAV